MSSKLSTLLRSMATMPFPPQPESGQNAEIDKRPASPAATSGSPHNIAAVPTTGHHSGRNRIRSAARSNSPFLAFSRVAEPTQIARSVTTGALGCPSAVTRTSLLLDLSLRNFQSESENSFIPAGGISASDEAHLPERIIGTESCESSEYASRLLTHWMTGPTCGPLTTPATTATGSSGVMSEGQINATRPQQSILRSTGGVSGSAHGRPSSSRTPSNSLKIAAVICASSSGHRIN